VRQGVSVVGSLGSTTDDKSVGGLHAPEGGQPSKGVERVIEATAGGVVPITPSLEVGDALVASRHQPGSHRSGTRTSVRVEGRGRRGGSARRKPASSRAVGI
jgi:hypothetical protein